MSGRRSPCPSRTPTCVNAQQGVKLGQQAQRSAAQAQRSEAGKLSQLARGEHTLEWLGRELCLCHRCWVLINQTRGKPHCPVRVLRADCCCTPTVRLRDRLP